MIYLIADHYGYDVLQLECIKCMLIALFHFLLYSQMENKEWDKEQGYKGRIRVGQRKCIIRCCWWFAGNHFGAYCSTKGIGELYCNIINNLDMGLFICKPVTLCNVQI